MQINIEDENSMNDDNRETTAKTNHTVPDVILSIEVHDDIATEAENLTNHTVPDMIQSIDHTEDNDKAILVLLLKLKRKL